MTASRREVPAGREGLEPLVSTRLTISQIGPADIDDEFAAMYTNEDGRNDHFRKSGQTLSKAELQAFCSRGIEEDNCFYYAVRTREDRALIGSIRIGVIDPTNNTSDLVALIGESALRGSGFGTEAIALASRAAFEIHGIRKLHSSILAANVGSLKAYTRAGWVEEGRLRDHLIINGEAMDLILVSCFAPESAQ